MADDQHITTVDGTGVPIPGDDVDTDQILPARFMKEVTFDNMADYLFYDARRDEDDEFNDHPLNRFEGANIAVVNKNFGCGSSREHAPQAMMRWGIDGIVGESFAEIFRDNCKSLGIPAVTASHEEVSKLQEWIEDHPDGTIEIDVEEELVAYGVRHHDERDEDSYEPGFSAEEFIEVDIDDAMQEALLEGIWDTTALMYSNLSKVEQTVGDLPYVDSD